MAKTSTITPVWGVTKNGIAGGIITDWEENEEAQLSYIQNEEGETIHTQAYDVKKTISCTMVSNGTSAPTVGKELTIDSKSYMVTGVRLIQNNQSAQKYAVTLEAWEGAPA